MKGAIKAIIHAIFWMVFLSFTVLVSIAGKYTSSRDGIAELAPHIAVNTVWAAIVFYLFYLYVIRYFEQRRFVRYLTYSIAFSVLITFCMMLVHMLILPNLKVFLPNIFALSAIGSFIIAQCGSLVRGFENWFSNMRLKAELENRNLRNELELLKSQVNPHFLFNTLNNIDSLIHSSPNDASKSLITLSELLRYMIYDTQSELVPLQKEADYIKRYVELQQLRFKKPDAIRLDLGAACNDDFIAPMLFVPFVENAFKYASNTGALPAVDISLSCANKNLYFRCFNYYNPSKPTNARNGGVGLENVKRRLALLYPQKHQLIIQKANDTFTVELNLTL
jgi:two-component system, LytTR family, sensor kinase